MIERQESRVMTRVDRVGNAALYVFFVTAWVAPGIANLGLLLMLICCGITFRTTMSQWMQSPVFWLVIAWNLYLGLRLGVSYIENPEGIETHLSASGDFIKLSLFFIVGWWARGDEKKLRQLLLLAVCGIILNTLKRVDWETLPGILSAGERTGFGVQIPIAALLSGAVVLGLLCLQKVMTTAHSKVVFWRMSLWLVALLMSALIVVYTQTRAILLALVMLIPAILFIQYVGTSLRGAQPIHVYLKRLSGFVLITAVALIGVFQLDIVTTRLLSEIATIQAIFDPEQVVAGDSTGLRYHAFILGAERLLAQPLMGWGAGYEAAQLGAENLPRMLYHLHNTYLEFLVRFGVLGTGIVFIGMLLLQRGLYRAYRAHRISFELTLALVSLELLFAIWSLTDFQIMRGYCQMYWFVVGGIFVALTWPPVTIEQSKELRESNCATG